MPNSQKSPLILAYQKLITSKKISIDIKQKEVVKKLSLLHGSISSFVERNKGLLGKLSSIRTHRHRKPKGIYIYGDVGRGKSFLMDLFHENLPSSVKAKRIHFHAFMKSAHEKINFYREQGKTGVVELVSDEMSKNIDIICFDEMQVNDIADAMIIGRLFKAIFAKNVVLVVTSNRAPDDLYKDGLQRERFLPFIEIFKESMEVIELEGLKDYRLQRMKSLNKTYYSPLGRDAKGFIEKAYKDLVGGKDINDKSKIIVKGRKIIVPKSYMGIAQFSFKDLCDVPLGSEDYLEIARQFNTIILTDIPKLKKDDHNQAIRFTNLIDALYEQKTKLIASAAVPPAELYNEGERAFEFERTVSRLIEMQSDAYLAEGHKS